MQNGIIAILRVLLQCKRTTAASICAAYTHGVPFDAKSKLSTRAILSAVDDNVVECENDNAKNATLLLLCLTIHFVRSTTHLAAVRPATGA